MAKVSFCSFLASLIFFFLAAIGSHFIPNATNWGFVALALGLVTGGMPWIPWKKSA